jgi:hypothetical protein
MKAKTFMAVPDPCEADQIVFQGKLYEKVIVKTSTTIITI